ncbi:MAG: serine protease [Bacteroidaceae bacterium]|nr:serine protease [Bacteroidaceae bacterium]
MSSFLSTLDTPLRIFWIIAIAASVVFVVQTIMTFIGFGGDADFDEISTAETVDDAGFSGLFSFRNLINFLLGYGWTGVILYDDITKPFWLYAISFGVGVLFVAAFVFMFRKMMKLSHDGSFRISEAVGITADVYLRIPASNGGRGKVQFSVKGSVHELDAVTDESEEIPTGAKAKIVDTLGDDVVKVVRIN